MSIISHHSGATGAVALAILIAGCANTPEPAPPSALDEPIDAFEAVGQPQRPTSDPLNERDELSTDIERLQNARDTYRRARERHTAETARRQAECRARPDSREVAIQDGSGDPEAVYCRPAQDSAGK